MFTENEKKYKTILSNLLGVSAGDKAIFTKIDNTYFFDFYKTFGKDVFDQIYNSKDFNIDIL
ncbi:hypothetical protein [Mycoplasmopsis californica]|nr:hypothetical protein [Mycoplasmopsis californica]